MASNTSDSSTTIASLTRNLSLAALMTLGLSAPTFATVKTAQITERPKVENDRVTLRVKVKDTADRPVVILNEQNFQLLIDNQLLQIKPKDWKSPKESVPPPAWIVVLIDMSGSMKNADAKGQVKLQGALAALRKFQETLIARSENLPLENIPQLALVPFGQGTQGSGCSGFPVEAETLDKFFAATDFKLQNHVDYLGTLKPCAATNLYEPLNKAVKMLGNARDERFSPTAEGAQKPRLSVILLSDGYHSVGNEQSDFTGLKSLLQSNQQIAVHTLGYGLTPEELGRKYKLNRAATRQDVWSGNCAGDPSKAPAGKVCDEDFVDQSRLQEIAQITGGISEFSADTTAVAEKLNLFLDALLGEYEISFEQPLSERGSKHEAQVVVKESNTSITSERAPYTITVFGRTVPLQIRGGVFGVTLLALLAGGVLPFWLWSKSLKQEA
jgi:hypothetical protein